MIIIKSRKYIINIIKRFKEYINDYKITFNKIFMNKFDKLVDMGK